MAKMFCSLDEAAAKLKVTPEVVKEMADKRQLEVFRDRDRLMFKVEQVDLLAGGLEEKDEIIPLASSLAEVEAVGLASAGNPFPAGSLLSDEQRSIGMSVFERDEQGIGISIFDADVTNDTDPMAVTRVQRTSGFNDAGIMDLSADADSHSGPRFTDTSIFDADATDEADPSVVTRVQATLPTPNDTFAVKLGTFSTTVITAMRELKTDRLQRALVDVLVNRLTAKELTAVTNHAAKHLRVSHSVQSYLDLKSEEACLSGESDKDLFYFGDHLPEKLLHARVQWIKSQNAPDQKNELALLALATPRRFDNGDRISYFYSGGRGNGSGHYIPFFDLCYAYQRVQSDRSSHISLLAQYVVELHESIGTPSDKICQIVSNIAHNIEEITDNEKEEFFLSAAKKSKDGTIHQAELFHGYYQLRMSRSLNANPDSAESCDEAVIFGARYWEELKDQRLNTRTRRAKTWLSEKLGSKTPSTPFYQTFERLRTSLLKLDAAREELFAAIAQEKAQPTVANPPAMAVS